MQHRDRIILQKIIFESSLGMEMLGKIDLEDFLHDEKLKRAIGMTSINIGELVKNLTPDFREKYPDIKWKAIAGMRDITAHKYQTLRMEDLYNTVQIDFPKLKKDIEIILEEGGSE